jgi:hypothetical protein
MTRGRLRCELTRWDRNAATAEMNSQSGPCDAIEILVPYSLRVVVVVGYRQNPSIQGRRAS